MAFNFANFIGGATDQYNVEANRDLQRRQVANAEAAQRDRELSSAIERQAAQRKLDMESALQAGEVEHAKNLQNVGKQVEVDMPTTIQGAVPALLSPQSQNSAGAQAIKPIDFTQPIPTDAPADVPFSVGGTTKAKKLYLQSDALRDTAAKLAGNPLTAGAANKVAAEALAMRHGEAFDLAAKSGDLTAAERHLRGTNDIQVVTDPGGRISVKGADGAVLEQFANKNEYLQRLAATATPQTMGNYQKLLDDQERARIKAEQDSRDKNIDQQLRLLGIEARLSGRSGNGAGSGASRTSSAKTGEDFMKISDFKTVFGKVTDQNGNEKPIAGYYALAQRIHAANPQGFTPEDAAALSAQVAAGIAPVRATFNGDTGHWEEMVVDPRSKRPVMTGRAVSPEWDEFLQIPTDSSGNALEGQDLVDAQKQAKSSAIKAARDTEAQWLVSMQKARPEEWSKAQQTIGNPEAKERLEQALNSGLLQGDEANKAMRILSMRETALRAIENASKADKQGSNAGGGNTKSAPSVTPGGLRAFQERGESGMQTAFLPGVGVVDTQGGLAAKAQSEAEAKSATAREEAKRVEERERAIIRAANARLPAEQTARLRAIESGDLKKYIAEERARIAKTNIAGR
jgi:hypothetical protein